MRERGLRAWLAEAEQIDRAVYAAVAETSTPLLDATMRRLAHVADYSRLSIASSVLLAAAGGSPGRRAARSGLASVAATSAFVNLVVKPIGRRRRPEDVEDIQATRQIAMPSSKSFPSGHTAAAVAFASGAGRVLPVASLPLHALAAAVGYSRVHTGVHYPGDVLAGATIGAIIADVTSAALAAFGRRRAREVLDGRHDG